MEPLIHVVGHFGTTYSYATVAARVSRSLREHGLLGAVVNLDTKWHDAFSDLRVEERPCTHALLFTAPSEHFSIYPERFGKQRSAIYASPNTNILSDEHARLFAQFGLIIAPSEYCAQTARSYVESDSEVYLLRLGVDKLYAADRVGRMNRLRERLQVDPVFVHLGTDHVWPGRKGTEELIEAWEIATREYMTTGKLIIHVPESVGAMAEMCVRDTGRERSDFLERVEIVGASYRGSSDEELVELYDKADVMVLPSRCEGYGIMLQGSIVAGVPMITTVGTGQNDFLLSNPGCWFGVPSATSSELPYEAGEAPCIDSSILASSLAFCATPDVRSIMLERMPDDITDEFWDAAMSEWMEALKHWTNGGL